MIRRGCLVCQGDLFPIEEERNESYWACLQCGRPFRLIVGAIVSAMTKESKRPRAKGPVRGRIKL